MKKQDGAAARFDFEAAMKELEGIVGRLETGNLGLDESLKLFERGVELARQCKVRLDEAELKVSKLVKEKEGLFRQEPLGDDE
jgi:exodeoxyribonuclease VII small subunit